MVVVSDTSVLIDLERGSLLTASFSLGCGFAVPDVLYERELKPFGGDDLRRRGLRVEALDSAGVSLALGYRRSRAGLSLPDAFALALAKSNAWMLLTGDADLRQLAEREVVVCHGIPGRAGSHDGPWPGVTITGAARDLISPERRFASTAVETRIPYMTDTPPAAHSLAVRDAAGNPSTDSSGVRDRVVDALRLDLVGPRAGHALAVERLPGWVRPSNWYLTGFLVPSGMPPERCADADEDDDFDAEVPEDAGLAEESGEDRRAAEKGYFPSSMGISFLAPAAAKRLLVTVRWGDYTQGQFDDASGKTERVWARTPRATKVAVALVDDFPAEASASVSPETPARGAERIADAGADLEQRLVDTFLGRVRAQPLDDVEREERLQSVGNRIDDLLDAWRAIVDGYRNGGVAVQYQKHEERQPRPLLREMLDTAFESENHRKFRANRSLRDVEPEVNLFLTDLSDDSAQVGGDA